MKSERRHELQHNALAKWLSDFTEALKPYQNVILTAVVLGAGAIAAYAWWSRTSASQTTKAWDELNAGLGSGNLVKLMEVADKYPDTRVAHLSVMVAADCRLAGGCDQLFVNKAIAQQELSKAIELYRLDFKQGQASSLLERATFGLARANESKGDLEPAAKYYRQLVENWPNGAYAVAARQRLDDLDRPETKRMYDDFRHFDPKPAFSDKTILPDEPPSFDLDSLPDEGPADQK